jgi:ABC-type transporter Mla subunit MlaD
MLYRRTDDVEKLQKVIADTEQQFVECLQQIKMLSEEKEQRQKELEDLRVAAQQLVEVVDPQDDGAADGRSLLDRLRGAPQKVLSFIAEAPTTYVSHALGLVKSFWPKARLEVLAQGVAADCSEEQFNEYLREARPVVSLPYDFWIASTFIG